MGSGTSCGFGFGGSFCATGGGGLAGDFSFGLISTGSIWTGFFFFAGFASSFFGGGGGIQNGVGSCWARAAQAQQNASRSARFIGTPRAVAPWDRKERRWA